MSGAPGGLPPGIQLDSLHSKREARPGLVLTGVAETD